MSVQFRSRIKSVVDYSKVLNGIGICCDKNGNKTLKSFYDCFNDGGNYFPGTVPDQLTCPPADTEKGCCCACSFVDDLSLLPYPWNFATSSPPPGELYLGSGVACGVSRCECDRLNGMFYATNEQNIQLTAENISALCYKSAPEFGDGYIIDARYPRACCHLDVDPQTGWPTNLVCDNICVKENCSTLGTIANPAVYNDRAVCGQNLFIDGGVPGGLQNCSTPLKISQIINKTTTYDDTDVYGSCYELEKSEDTQSLEYTCNIKQKNTCNGYWTERKNLFCNDKYTPSNPVKVNNTYDVQKLTTTQFNSLELMPGDKFQGGMYIGVFEPGDPVNNQGSRLFGNLNFDRPQYFYPTNVGIGSEHKKWAVIVNESSYNVSFLQEEESDIDYNTSLWDGYYNTYGNSKTFTGIKTVLTNTIKYKDRGGFIDYYIPSIYELYFYWAYLATVNVKPVYSTFYMTSSMFNYSNINQNTNKSKINNKGMIYAGLSIFPSYLFRTVLAEKTKNLNLLLFRKIVIED